MLVPGIEILLDAIKLIGRHEKLVRSLVLNEQELLFDTLLDALHEAAKYADAKVDVNDVVARLEVQNRGDRRAFHESALGQFEPRNAKQLGIGEERDFRARNHEPAAKVAVTSVTAWASRSSATPISAPARTAVARLGWSVHNATSTLSARYCFSVLVSASGLPR